MGCPPITRWEVMKERLEDRYFPSDYLDLFQRELFNLQQRSMPYTHKFHELCIRCKTNESDCLMVNHYQEILLPNIKHEMLMFDFANTDKYLARCDELSKSCVSRLDDVSVPKPRSLSIERVPFLVSIGAHNRVPTTSRTVIRTQTQNYSSARVSLNFGPR